MPFTVKYYRLGSGCKPVPTDMQFVSGGESSRIVRTTCYFGVSVSTVLLFITAGYDDEPMYETMIFGGPADLTCYRADSVTEACCNHVRAILNALESRKVFKTWQHRFIHPLLPDDEREILNTFKP